MVNSYIVLFSFLVLVICIYILYTSFSKYKMKAKPYSTNTMVKTSNSADTHKTIDNKSNTTSSNIIQESKSFFKYKIVKY